MRTNINKIFLCLASIITFSFVMPGQNTISFTVDIIDECGSATDFHGYGWVEDEWVTPFDIYCKNPVAQISPPTFHDYDYVSFNCSVPYDANNRRYRIHITVWEDDNETCIGTAQSNDTFTSDQLYSVNGIGTITVTLE